MYEDLYQFLLQHRQLTLPGVGTFLLERQPADIDFASKQINPPTYSVVLQHGHLQSSPQLPTWLSHLWEVSESEAVQRFDRFVDDMKVQMQEGKKMYWNGVGVLAKGLAGEIRFEAILKNKPAGPAVPAIKVLRENAAHTVRVGEDEKTSEEMIEILHPANKKRSYEWVITLVLVLLGLIFLLIHFIEHGGATGNRQVITPKAETPAHRDLP